MSITIQKLRDEDKGYALSSWRESHKAAPGVDRLPWSYYKRAWGDLFARIVNDSNTVLLGAYDHHGELVGWLAMTPSTRTNILHWVHVKWQVGNLPMRRRGLMMLLLDEAGLLRKDRHFIYTLHARRDRAQLPDGSKSKSLDESLVVALRARGVNATYVALKDWLK